MNLHEYQAKQLLRDAAIATPPGIVISDPGEIAPALQQLGSGPWIIKAQIHAGGRGKAGGVALVESADAAKQAAGRLLGSRLVTLQNGPDGQPVSQLLLEAGVPIQREFYLSLSMDRALERVVLIASKAGGMEIEEIALSAPDQILREVCDPLLGLQPYQGRAMAFALGLSDGAVNEFAKLARKAYDLFLLHDLSMLEINPLVLTERGSLIALDCKISLDDNAIWRQQALAAMRDWSQEDSKEAAAHAASLNYIALSGDIGCMVNGAGLAMATMDLIAQKGGAPANFLDVGGAANAETVAKGFEIIVTDPNVKAILVNIFGGIMRCDIIAEGIISAVQRLGLTIPVVVRLEGTNAQLGLKMLAESGLAIMPANDLSAAAERAVEATGVKLL